jgi:hypothetical protein
MVWGMIRRRFFWILNQFWTGECFRDWIGWEVWIGFSVEITLAKLSAIMNRVCWHVYDDRC